MEQWVKNFEYLLLRSLVQRWYNVSTKVNFTVMKSHFYLEVGEDQIRNFLLLATLFTDLTTLTFIIVYYFQPRVFRLEYIQ